MHFRLNLIVLEKRNILNDPFGRFIMHELHIPRLASLSALSDPFEW